jgi:hypothetical protein
MTDHRPGFAESRQQQDWILKCLQSEPVLSQCVGWRYTLRWNRNPNETIYETADKDACGAQDGGVVRGDGQVSHLPLDAGPHASPRGGQGRGRPQPQDGFDVLRPGAVVFRQQQHPLLLPHVPRAPVLPGAPTRSACVCSKPSSSRFRFERERLRGVVFHAHQVLQQLKIGTTAIAFRVLMARVRARAVARQPSLLVQPRPRCVS